MLLESDYGPWLVIGVIALVFIYNHRDTAIGARRRPDLPNSWPTRSLPLFGDSFSTLKRSDRLLEHALKSLEETGPVSTFCIPWQRMIFINRPEWIEYARTHEHLHRSLMIMRGDNALEKTNFQNYEKGWLQQGIMRDVLGTGIFAIDGPDWHAKRKTTSRIFSAALFRTIIADSIEGHLSHLVNILSKKADANEEVHLNVVFFRYTLDVFTKLAFGIELNCVGKDENVPFADAFDYAQARIDSRALELGWKWTEPFTANGRKMRAARKTIDEFSYGIIDERDKLDQSGTGEKGTSDLLSLYRSIRDDKGQPMSRKELRDSVLNLIIAGRDTTAQVLSWCFFHVCRKPELLEPVRKEAKELLPDGKVTYDNFRSLVQANALFNEVLRLHPSVPKNAKVACKDDVLPGGGPTIHANEILIFSDWVSGRDPAIWGADAKEMKPARWIDENGELRTFDQFKFHAFNGGPRLCLGQTLATFEAVSVIECLAKNFDFKFAPGYMETTPLTEGIVDCGVAAPLYQTSLTLPMRDAMRLNVTRRQQ